MNYFKNSSGQVFAFEADGSQDDYRPKGLTELTAPEIEDHLNPPVAIRGLIAARRWQVETGGIEIGGILIDSDRDSQALITGAALNAVIDPTYVCNWKTPSGFVQLDAQTLLGVAVKLRGHVQACFDREADLLVAVADGTYTSDMLNEGWPDVQISARAAG